MKSSKYALSIILSVALFALPAGCLVWAIISHTIVSYIFLCVTTIAAIILYRPVSNLRIESRKDVEYDEFGLSKTKGKYERLSKKERDAIDLQKTAHAEIVLDSTALRKMTKTGSTDPDNDLSKLIGLNEVKSKVQALAARMKFEQEEKRNRARVKELKREGKSTESLSGRHMVFFGPPGTGKTTVARIMTGYLYRYGFIKENKCVEVDGNFLKAGEDTALKTSLVIRQAFGGVLFIDEAYALIQGTHGDEAIATIIKQMEDDRSRFVLILAGYTDEMMSLIQSNTGFESRIKEYLYFRDYSDQELFEIFTSMLNQRGFVASEQAIMPFMIRIGKEKSQNAFGNARTIRNIVEETIDRHSLNCEQGRVAKEDRYRIGADDVSTTITGMRRN